MQSSLPTHLSAYLSELPETLAPQAAPGVWPMVFRLLPEPCKILNAGAGRGGLSKILGQAGYAVTSVDLHPEHFQAPGLVCERADLLRPLEYPSASFDAVIAVEVLEHLENPWLFFRESIRVLRPGGVFLFTSPNVMSLASRVTFLAAGVLPYFREESFKGCYHVTPVFRWAVERACMTTSAALERVAFSRVDWPTGADIPRWSGGVRRHLLNALPVSELTGEIAAYRIRKTDASGSVRVGTHYA